MSHPFPTASPSTPRRPQPAQRGTAPCCSLRARPLPQPAPAPSWQDLLGER